MKTAFVLVVAAAVLTVVVLASDDHVYKQWGEFIHKYGKVYASEQESAYRFTVFRANLDVIKRLQANDPSAQYGVTKFADMTQAEFRASRLMPVFEAEGAKNSCLAHGVTMPQLRNDPVPSSIDWRDKGAVTPVKNQGGCGSCWAFSTTGNIESTQQTRDDVEAGQWFLAGNPLVSLSEQQIVDCDHSCSDVGDPPQVVCDAGCQGGWPWAAMYGIMQAGGIMSETAYPYTGMDGTCQFDKTKVAVKIANYTCLSTDEGEMAAYVAQNGPVSIALNAEHLQFYHSGVSDPISCEKTQLDHAVLVVGYGTASSLFGKKDFWLVKNSWGEDWGEKGYFRIMRGKGTCGVNNAVSSALIHYP